MAKQKHGPARPQRPLGEEADQFRKPVGYVNKDVVGTKPNVRTSDVLRIPIDMVEANPSSPVPLSMLRLWKNLPQASKHSVLFSP